MALLAVAAQLGVDVVRVEGLAVLAVAAAVRPGALLRRRRALEEVRVLLEELPSNQPGSVGGVKAQPGLLGYLLQASQIPLARCLLDPVEKCRELATETLVEVIGVVENADQLFETCLPVVTQRIGLKQVLCALHPPFPLHLAPA